MKEDMVEEFISKVKDLCKEYDVKNAVIGFDSDENFHGRFNLKEDGMNLQDMSLCMVNAGRLFQSLREKFLLLTNKYGHTF